MSSVKNLNSEKVCEQIWKEHEAYIRKFCEYKLQSDRDSVDDCVNEVFLRLLKTIKNNEDIKYPKAWLTRVANNLITDIYRHNDIKSEREIPLMEETVAEMQNYCDTYNFETVTDEQIEQIKETVLNQIDETDKKLIESYHIKNMKVKEIALQYNLSESNVKQRLFRARKTITCLSKKELGKYEE